MIKLGRQQAKGMLASKNEKQTHLDFDKAALPGAGPQRASALSPRADHLPKPSSRTLASQ